MIVTQLAALAMAAAVGNLPAAQDPPIWHEGQQSVEGKDVEQAAAAEVRQRFAACVYDRRRKVVDRILATSDTLNVDYEAAGIRRERLSASLGLDKCLDQATSVTDTDLRMSVHFPFLRAMLLEQSYRAHNPAGPAWIRSPAVAPVRRFVSSGDELAKAQAVATFVDCVVGRAPREADALLRTPGSSAAERAAIGRLVPHLGPCIIEGQEVQLNPAQLRAMIADGLWAAWRASASQPASAAGAN